MRQRVWADAGGKGRKLIRLCKRNKFDEIRYFLDDLSEDERRHVVNYKDKVKVKLDNEMAIYQILE